MHDADAGAPLAAVLRVLDAAVVERQAEAVPVLGVELGEVAAVGERPRKHALGQLGVDERHVALRPSPASSTILRAAASACSWPRASGCSSRASPSWS